MYHLICSTITGKSRTRVTTRMRHFNVAAVSFFEFILASYDVASIVALICMKTSQLLIQGGLNVLQRFSAKNYYHYHASLAYDVSML